MEEQLVILLID